jgi:exodeoxyribonuclease VIII
MTEYNQIKAINWSTLKNLRRSPLHYKYRLQHPEPSKPAYTIGNAIHTLVLEPDKFESRFALCEMTRNARHKAYQEWMAEHPGVDALNAKEMEHAKASAAALLRHDAAAAILLACRKEEPLTWTDPTTGYKCKGRVDAIGRSVVDLKTTTTIAGGKFQTDAGKLMYQGQLAFYDMGARAANKIAPDAPPPAIIALEKDPPYDVGLIPVEGEALEAGRALVRDLMARLHVCIETDTWPGAMPDPEPLVLSNWAPGMEFLRERF